ncbi:MAG: hypothetical protein JKY08_10565, partial [Flavobacteriaceae bacterium]|nr:hypothetical protein [Flavobacteriaceae bacterium]
SCKQTKNSPAYKAFLTQEHRFVLNECELTYNEKPFYIGMPLKDLQKTFGTDNINEENINNYKIDPYYLFYPKKGVMALIENHKLRDIYVYMKNDDFQELIILTGNQSIIVNEAILSQTDKMHEYIKRAGFSFNDFLLSGNGYEQQYRCGEDTLIYVIGSKLYRERFGSGHLYTSGDWLLKETNTVNYIHIYKKD